MGTNASIVLLKSFQFYRLGISYPELTEMQARAVFEAAIAMSNQGVKVLPEIMVPLVGTPQVLIHLKATSCNYYHRLFVNMLFNFFFSSLHF